jgi:hypothetical protein
MKAYLISFLKHRFRLSKLSRDQLDDMGVLRSRFGLMDVEGRPFAYSRHGTGATYFDLFERSVIEIPNLLKWEHFQIYEFSLFLRSSGLNVDDENTELWLDHFLETGLLKRTADGFYSSEECAFMNFEDDTSI